MIGLLLQFKGNGLLNATDILIRLTTAVGNGFRDSEHPQISGDGSKIVFYSDSDFLELGTPDQENEIWLYDTTTAELTRITTAAGEDFRDSQYPDISSEGNKIVFHSDSDFLEQGIIDNQNEIWTNGRAINQLYLPFLAKN